MEFITELGVMVIHGAGLNVIGGFVPSTRNGNVSAKAGTVNPTQRLRKTG